MNSWKLIERFEDGTVQLYNLDKDIGELDDVARDFPERVSEMRQQLHGWYRAVDAKLLMPDGEGQGPWRPRED